METGFFKIDITPPYSIRGHVYDLTTGIVNLYRLYLLSNDQVIF